MPPWHSVQYASVWQAIDASGLAVVLHPGADVAGIESFMLADSVESSWRRIGIALGKIEGATIGDRAQLLNSYEVSYQGVSMLVRAEAVDGQTRVVALGQDGQPIRTGVATQLLALLKARLG